ncbi:hypothetical protein [Streptomyces diastatochromogenes]|uniref:hypothetical protein n=1 Tax=Streptomyces diastatochromogenes TaxID=42236 RepID=UPI001FCA114D|nr:hypothetical protein [Streptomyces diastatochromogenes]
MAFPSRSSAGRPRPHRTLLTAGYSVHFDPALNDLAAPDGDREAALRYLAQLPQRTTRAESSHDWTALLTEIACPAEGLLPLIRQVVVAAWVCSLLPDFSSKDRELAAQLESRVDALSRATDQILLARNNSARAPNPGVRPPSPAQRPADAVSRSR